MNKLLLILTCSLLVANLLLFLFLIYQKTLNIGWQIINLIFMI